MTRAQVEYSWLDASETVTLTELSRCCEMSETELDELVDYCALVPVSAATPQRPFSAEWVVPLRTAAKLRQDFDLDLFTVVILLGNLCRIEILQRQVQQLQALLPARLKLRLSP